MSQLANRVGQGPQERQLAGPKPSHCLPRSLQEEASLDWSLHSRWAQVTGKNDAGL